MDTKLEEKIALVQELLGKRSVIDNQLAELFGSDVEPVEKPKRKYKAKGKKEKPQSGKHYLTDLEKDNIKKCFEAGDSIKNIAAKFNVSIACIYLNTKGMVRKQLVPTL